MRKNKLYMAGPLFSFAEKSFNVGLAHLLRIRGYEVFLPQEHEQRADRPDLIFKSDVDGIDWADAIVANLDGPDPDSGTCWELGYGFGVKKPCVTYRTDFRLFEGADKVNLMMTESSSSPTIYHSGSLTELANRIAHVLEGLGIQ